jgi:membrane-bound serine protease (ClpP class)
MKHISLYFFFILLSSLTRAQTVVSININSSINPVTAQFIHDAIEKANSEKATCLLIHLNTPGGLLVSTRVIVTDILQSPVPVIVYVSPGGAHAGSAGVFITMAAHVAAMAPGTNIGAAHPVTLQGSVDTVMNEKATNDAAAFIRTIAEWRNRNMQWPEEAVRSSVAITEHEALQKKVIDLIASNDEDLLNQLDSKTIQLTSGEVTLHTKGAAIEVYEMGTLDKLLNVLSDPNIAYILMLMGMFGILFELYNPGAILPGIVGVISLILAFYTMHTLPINYAGLALIIFAIVLFILEIKIVTHGLLAIGGVISLLLGSMMLIRASSSLEFVKLSRSVIITSTAVTSLFFLFVLGLGLKAQRRKPVTGMEGMIGLTGESLGTLSPFGKVRVHGELWNAESISENIDQGKKIRVTGIKNLKLYVEEV